MASNPLAQFLASKGYTPSLPNNTNFRQAIPLPDMPQQAPVGIPEDWDYRTAQQGPNGDPLPTGAIGWTPHGEAFYGGNSSIANWANGFVARMTRPSDANAPTAGDYFRESWEAMSEQGDYEGVSYWPRLGAVLANGVRGIGAFLGDFDTDDEGRPSPLTFITRGANEAVGGLLRVAGEVAEEAEQISGGLIEAAGGELNPLDQLLVNSTKGWEDNWAEVLGRTMLLGAARIPGIAIDAARAAIAPQEGKSDRFREGYEAGRILYTQFIDPAVKEEYMRRLRAGENPYLLAEELQNPMAELGGEIIADPLNFIGIVAKLARGGKSRFVGTVLDDFGRLDPELAELADLKKAGEISDSQFIERYVEGTKRWASDIRTATGKADDALTALDAGSKRRTFSNRVGTLFFHIASSQAKNPNKIDDTLEIVKALVNLHSDNPKILGEALSTLRASGLPMEMAQSKVAGELGYALNRILDNNPGKFLDDLRKAASKDEPVKALTEAFGSRLDDVTNELIPTWAERVKRGEKISAKARIWMGAEKLLSKKIYTGSRKLFGSLYLGWNPGYAGRNLFQNYLQIFADIGIQEIPGFAKREGLFRRFPWTAPQNSLDNIQRTLGRIPDEATKGLGAGEGVALGPSATFASKIESGAAAQIFSHTLRREMTRSYDVIFAQLGPELRKAGMVDDDIRLARKLMDDLHDVSAVKQRLLEHHATGFVDRFESFEWMDDGMTRTLEKFGGREAYQEALRGAETLEDAVNRSNDFFKNNFEDYAKLAALDPVTLPPDLVDDAFAMFEEAVQGGEAMMDLRDLNAAQRKINQAAEDAWLGVLDHVEDVAKRIGVDSNSLYESAAQRLNMSADELSFALSSANRRGGKDVVNASRRQFDAWANAVRSKFDGLLEANKLDEAGRMIGLESLPEGMSKGALKRYFWSNYFFPAERQLFSNTRDGYIGLVQSVVEEAGKLDPRLVPGKQLEDAWKYFGAAREWDNAAISTVTRLGVPGARQRVDSIYHLATMNGVFTEAPSGSTLDDVLKTIINKHLPEGKLDDFTQDDALELARSAFVARAEQKGVGFVDDLGDVPLVERSVEGLIPPWLNSDGTPSHARVIAENLGGLGDMRINFEKGIRDTFGQVRTVLDDADVELALNTFEKIATPQVQQAKLISEQVALASRNFALLDYSQRRNFDLLLGMIYPYSFWHTRTYGNWLKRVASNPGVIANYSKYKDTLAEIHAGAPDWWKYNINTNELFGLDSENPLYFNFEATFNPLHGLTGVDFEDRYKRVNWWTSTLDDLGKLGPSPWTPLSMATAYALYLDGEKDAAARWGGRFIPQTQTIQSAAVLAGAKPFELDPAVNFFSGGVDPYTEKRVGRALSTMVLEGEITEDQMVDAAAARSGDLWDEALGRAISERAPGQLASFFLGVGFKGRSVGDLQSDQFYNDYYRLLKMRDTMSSQQFRVEMENLKTRHPFMDGLLISRRGGDERDTGLAWNVLNRLPPGDSGLLDEIGIDRRLIDRFYDSKGDWSDWNPTDKERFMAGIVDLMGVLATPADATRQEWATVRNLYADMREAVTAYYGEGIHDKIDRFYALYSEDQAAGRDYLDANPDVEDALDRIDQFKATEPLVTTYYGGMDAIEGYYKNLMYDDIENQLGDIWAKFDSNTATSADRKAYAQIRDRWLETIDEAVLRIGSTLPERQGAELREDLPAEPGIIQQDAIQSFEPVQVSEQQLVRALGETGYAILRDFLATGVAMSPGVRRDVSELAEDLGLSYFGLLNILQGRLITP